MKQLLKKEFTFTALPLCYLFLLFSGMTMIPGYPIAMDSFFLCLALFQSMQSRREQNDLSYTLLLPVSKKQVVRANYLFCIGLQMLFFLLCAMLTVIRMQFLSLAAVYTENAMMNANPAYLANILLVFLAFNVLVPGPYWKTGYGLGKPFVLFSAAALLIVTAGEILHHLPGLEGLNAPAGQGMLPNSGVFALCRSLCPWQLARRRAGRAEFRDCGPVSRGNHNFPLEFFKKNESFL